MGYWGIATGVIGSAELADGSIVAIDLCDGAVITCKLANDAVTDMKLAPVAVQTVHVADGAIVAAHIGTGQVFGSHISDGQIGNSKLINGSITGGKLCYGGSGLNFTGKVRTCGSCGFVIPNGVGSSEAGGLRYCSSSSVLQYYNGAWQSITQSGYQLGTDFYLPTSHAWSQDGELWWDSGYYRPAFYCGGSEYGLLSNPLPTSIPWSADGEFFWDSGAYRPAFYCGGSSYCLSTYEEFSNLCSTVDDVCSCVADNCSRIDSLESGGFYSLGDDFYLPSSHAWSDDGELWWDSTYYRPAFYCGGSEYGVLSNPLPTSVPGNDGELKWDDCNYRPQYCCGGSGYELWALCTPLTVPTAYDGSSNGELRWCSSYNRLEFYCNGSWYYINSDGSA